MSDSTLHYAIQIAQAESAHLAGVFLDDFSYHRYNVVKVMNSSDDYEKEIAELDAKDLQKRDESVQKFQSVCSKAGVPFTFHRNRSLALLELKAESIFADLIIINEYETFTRYKEESPTRFIKDLLSDVQCPVLVVPKDHIRIDKAVLLYDGSAASVYTIKMFSYLLTSFQHLPTEVFTVNDPLSNLRLPGGKQMREFIRQHFPNASFTITKGNPAEQILGHLRNHKENELVVLGAYCRTELSQWLKKSMADTLMSELNLPLFIAHNK